MMSRGDSELACLDCVRNNIIQKDCFGRVSLSNKQNWYGLHCDQDTKYDPILLAEFLTECKPNPAPSCFPDFVHQSGFIEHFRFSPSDTDNHGSKYITEKNKTQNMIQYSLIASNEERLENSTSKHPVGAIGRVVIFIPKQSYDSAFESFKRHWDKHIRSLEKYNGDKTIGVFLVECMESGLSMHENVYASIEKKTVHLGDLVKTPDIIISA